MFHQMKSVVAAVAVLIALSVPAWAGKPYFELKTSKSPQAIPIGDKEFAEIGTKEITTTIFTTNDRKHIFKGVLMRDLVKYSGETSHSVRLTALDGYAMDLPMSDFEKYDAVVATEMDGKPLSVRDHGPAWLVYPASDHPELKDTVYDSRSVWQIKTIEID